MNIDQIINNFLRDASYRIAEYSIVIDTKKKEGENYDKERHLRSVLIQAMQVFYAPKQNLKEGYNYASNWTDRQIQAEIEFLRKVTKMTKYPSLTFTGYSPLIRQEILGDSGNATLPLGSTNDILVYSGNNNNPDPVPFPMEGGYKQESIDVYFGGSSVARVRRLYHPTFTESEWFSENPTLKEGEMGFVKDDNGSITGYKVGAGKWNDLELLNKPVYTIKSAATVDIGDVKKGDTFDGEFQEDIINKIISPYLAPSIEDLKNDVEGIFKAESILEVGDSITDSLKIKYTLKNPDNINDLDQIFIDGGGLFSNEGLRGHTGAALTLNLNSSPLSPISKITYPIKARVTGKNGNVSEYAITNIKFQSAILWGYDTDDDLLPAGGSYNNPFPAANRNVADSYEDFVYLFSGTGYPYICIPDDMNPSNLYFAEVANPLLPSNYSFVYKGKVTINNGTGTYSYHVYRGEFFQNFDTKMKVSNG